MGFCFFCCHILASGSAPGRPGVKVSVHWGAGPGGGVLRAPPARLIHYKPKGSRELRTCDGAHRTHNYSPIEHCAPTGRHPHLEHPNVGDLTVCWGLILTTEQQ